MRYSISVLCATLILFVGATGQIDDKHIARLRELLNIPPSKSITVAGSKILPTGALLKIHLDKVLDRKIRDKIIEWIKEWNNENGAKYGSFKVVSDISQADVILARYTLPFPPSPKTGRVERPDLILAYTYILVPEPTRIEMLWYQPVVTNKDNYKTTTLSIVKEVENRMRTRFEEQRKRLNG
jgi:hypothetical protein